MNHRLRSGCCTTAVSSGSSTNFCRATLAVSSCAAEAAESVVVAAASWWQQAPVESFPALGTVVAPGAAVAPGAVGVPGAAVAPGAVVSPGVSALSRRHRRRMRWPARASGDHADCRPEPPGRGTENIGRTIVRDHRDCRHPMHALSMSSRRWPRSPTSSWRPRSGAKAALIASLLTRLEPAEVAPAVAFLTGTPMQGASASAGRPCGRSSRSWPAVVDRGRGRPGDEPAGGHVGCRRHRRPPGSADGCLQPRHGAGARAVVAHLQRRAPPRRSTA